MKKIVSCLCVLSIVSGILPYGSTKAQATNKPESSAEQNEHIEVQKTEKSDMKTTAAQRALPRMVKSDFSISIDDAGPVTSQEDINLIKELSRKKNGRETQEVTESERESEKFSLDPSTEQQGEESDTNEMGEIKQEITELLPKQPGENGQEAKEPIFDEESDAEQKTEQPNIDQQESDKTEKKNEALISRWLKHVQKNEEPRKFFSGQFNESQKQGYVQKKEVNTYNEVARKIAGLAGDSSPEYSVYSDEISQSWDKLCNVSLAKVRLWAEKHLDSYMKSIRRVFYAFGGPDISYPCQFFPYADEYILVGLEPLGNFHEIKNLSDSGNLGAFRSAINSYLRKGYFITSEMGSQLSRKSGGSRGGLGMIMLQLARMRYEVVSIESCAINNYGEVVPSSAGTLPIVKVVFKKDPTKKDLSTIYYVRMDLSNRNTSCLKKLCSFAQKRQFVAFIKSASYILQDRNFTILRNFILGNAESILQDDTGIAFNLLGNWERHIFGTYTGATLKIFKNYIQYDMAAYFRNHPAKPIDFQIGYGFDQKRPSLVLALRRGIPKDETCVQRDIEDCYVRPVSVSKREENVKTTRYEDKTRVKSVLMRSFRM